MIRVVMRDIMVVLIFTEWIYDINGAPQAFANFGFGAASYPVTRAGRVLPRSPGNPLLELETLLYNFLSIDPKECLLYGFCKHASDDTQPVFQQSMAPALRALRFVVYNLHAISEITGFNEHQKLPGLKAFAAAGFMGAARKNATICHEKYPGCPTNPGQLGMYLKRFTSMKEISQFTEAFIDNSLTTSTRPTGLDNADIGPSSVHDMNFRRRGFGTIHRKWQWNNKRWPPPDLSFVRPRHGQRKLLVRHSNAVYW